MLRPVLDVMSSDVLNDPTVRKGILTAMLAASSDPAMLALLRDCDERFDWTVVHQVSFHTPLHAAVESGCLAAVDLVLAHPGVELNAWSRVRCFVLRRASVCL